MERAAPHLVGREGCGIAALVAAVELGAVGKRASVVAFAGGVFGGVKEAAAVLEHFVLQARGQRDDAGFGFVFFEPFEAFRMGSSKCQGRRGKKEDEGEGAGERKHCKVAILTSNLGTFEFKSYHKPCNMCITARQQPAQVLDAGVWQQV